MTIKADTTSDQSQVREMHRERLLLGSIDQGTTSSRFHIFDHDGDLIAGHQLSFENLYPHSG